MFKLSNVRLWKFKIPNVWCSNAIRVKVKINFNRRPRWRGWDATAAGSIPAVGQMFVWPVNIYSGSRCRGTIVFDSGNPSVRSRLCMWQTAVICKLNDSTLWKKYNDISQVKEHIQTWFNKTSTKNRVETNRKWVD